MIRTLQALGLASGILLLGLVPSAVAADPIRGCGAASSGFDLLAVDRDWTPAQGLPAAGTDEWWERTLAGFEAEGMDPEEAAALFGFESVLELYEFGLAGIIALDMNADGWICGKPFPAHQNGSALYQFNGKDNRAAL